jgi:hypothetical protein
LVFPAFPHEWRIDALPHFAGLDEKGELTNLFDRAAEITDEDRCIVESKEGWILGVR